MRTILLLFLSIILSGLPLHAETGSAESGEFSIDVRDKGGVSSMGSAEFALDTTGSGAGWLEVSASARIHDQNRF